MAMYKLKPGEFPELERSAVYQVVQPGLVEGGYYLAVDPDREVANVYCVDANGTPTTADSSTLYLKTLAEVEMSEDNLLVLRGREAIYQAVRDWSEEDHEKIFQDLQWDVKDLPYDASLREVSDFLGNDEAYAYFVDPYADDRAEVLSQGEQPSDGLPAGPTPNVDGGGESPAAPDAGEQGDEPV